MRVFLTGGTGLIGRGVTRALLSRGDTPVILTRHADKARLNPRLKGAEIIQGDPSAMGSWETSVDGCDAVINLAGHNIFADRWSPDIKAKIRDSRVVGTEHVVEAIERASNRPKVLVQASAIGYYGPTDDQELTESSPAGNDFMAGVCVAWEAAAKPAEAMGLRVPRIRTGIVLAKDAGALGVMTPIFKWAPGGAAPVGSGVKPFESQSGQAGANLLGQLKSFALRSTKFWGNGKQWMSWIHIDDIVGLFIEALDNPNASGPLNGTSPKPVRNVEFSKALSKAIRKSTPVGLKVLLPYTGIYVPIGPPDPVLYTMLGEVAEIITTGQRVVPRKAEQLGYRFRYPLLFEALAEIFGSAAAPVAPKVMAQPVGAGR